MDLAEFTGKKGYRAGEMTQELTAPAVELGSDDLSWIPSGGKREHIPTSAHHHTGIPTHTRAT